MSKKSGLVENSVDAGETPHCAVSSGSTCLISPVYPNTYGTYTENTGQTENRLDADRDAAFCSLIWVYTVCSGMSVRIHTEQMEQPRAAYEGLAT